MTIRRIAKKFGPRFVKGALRGAAMAYASRKFRPKNRAKSLARLPARQRARAGAKSLYHRVLHRDGPMSNSFHRWHAKKQFSLGKLKIVGATQFFVANNSCRISCSIGQQAVSGWNGSSIQSQPGLYTYQDINAIFDQAQVPSSSNFVVNTTTQKVYMSKCTSELMITNQTDDVVNLKIYECVARRDITDTSYGSPGPAWNQGNLDENVTNYYTIVGSNPFQAPGFTEYWKVEKVIDVDLHTGGHHTHRSMCSPKRMFSNEIMQQFNNNQAIGKWTRYSFVVIHGYPINDGVTKTNISTAPVAVDLIWKKQYEYFVLQNSSVALTSTNTLPTTFSLGATSGTLMNDLTGALQYIVQA